MLANLINKVSTILYVQIWDNRLKITNMKTGNIYDDKPLIAIENEKIIAIGKNASSYPNAINPFAHTRVVFDNYKMAELIMRHAFEEATQRKIIFSPIAIVHVMKNLNTHLTDIEKIALCELSANAGARESIIYDGKELNMHDFNYDEIKSKSYIVTSEKPNYLPKIGTLEAI